ncbi:hypothetical protein ABIA25_001629 [Sinorhizobium fredii]|uniref:hypothetical protein n=1 Tax=Rhizobium fredii TaxID=380 RepID=UPI0035198CE9
MPLRELCGTKIIQRLALLFRFPHPALKLSPRPLWSRPAIAVIERSVVDNLEFGLEPLGQPLRDIPLRCVPWRGVDADEHGAILDRYFPDGGAQEFLHGRVLNSIAIPPKADLRPQSRDDVAGKEDGALWITPPPLAFGCEAIQDRATDHSEANEDRTFNIVIWLCHAASPSVEVVDIPHVVEGARQRRCSLI